MIAREIPKLGVILISRSHVGKAIEHENSKLGAGDGMIGAKAAIGISIEDVLSGQLADTISSPMV
jgi:tRNA(Ile2) C34 agmatinyltransferase TiaS